MVDIVLSHHKPELAKRGSEVVWLDKRAGDMDRDELLSLVGFLDFMIERGHTEIP